MISIGDVDVACQPRAPPRWSRVAARRTRAPVGTQITRRVIDLR
eukprot:COSAG02_NODE_17268_length_1017_cov_0.959695_2_plen_43_part_01